MKNFVANFIAGVIMMLLVLIVLAGVSFFIDLGG